MFVCCVCPICGLEFVHLSMNMHACASVYLRFRLLFLPCVHTQSVCGTIILDFGERKKMK